MEYFARKISIAKWKQESSANPDDIRADAITGCLRTKEDTLSFWLCTQDRTDVAEVALALASKMEQAETIHIVLVCRNDLDTDGLEIRITAPDIPVADLKERHRDLVNLNMIKLCCVARNVAKRVRQDNAHYLFSKTTVLDILKSAIDLGRLDISKLSEKMRQKVLSHNMK